MQKCIIGKKIGMTQLFDEKGRWMDLDVKYVKERSFWVDWKIIFKTFKVCLLGRGE